MVNLSAYQFADLPVFLYLLTQVSPPESVTCIIQLLIEHFYLIIFVHFYINIYRCNKKLVLDFEIFIIRHSMITDYIKWNKKQISNTHNQGYRHTYDYT